jgi:hypothetical protein
MKIGAVFFCPLEGDGRRRATVFKIESQLMVSSILKVMLPLFDTLNPFSLIMNESPLFHICVILVSV